MRLTPMDIHHKEFRHAIRGYSEEEVDDFLDEVVAEFEKLFKENVDLKEQIERVRDKMTQYENLDETLRNTLITAQKSAEDVQRNAKREADLIIRDSELKARDILQDAQIQRQELEKEITRLIQAEQEFRVKFKSLLESYLKIIGQPPGEEVEAAVAEVTETETAAASVISEEKEAAAEEETQAAEHPSEEIPIVEEATRQETDTSFRPSYFASEGSGGHTEPTHRKEDRYEELGEDEDLIYRID